MLANNSKNSGYCRLKKGIKYFNDSDNAQKVLNSIKYQYPESRVVYFKLGFAVQYRISGPYYPELEQ